MQVEEAAQALIKQDNDFEPLWNLWMVLLKQEIPSASPEYAF